MKPERESMLPIFCPHCERTIYVAITKLQHSIVGVVCTSCRKSIPITPEFVAVVRG